MNILQSLPFSLLHFIELISIKNVNFQLESRAVVLRSLWQKSYLVRTPARKLRVSVWQASLAKSAELTRWLWSAAISCLNWKNERGAWWTRRRTFQHRLTDWCSNIKTKNGISYETTDLLNSSGSFKYGRTISYQKIRGSYFICEFCYKTTKSKKEKTTKIKKRKIQKYQKKNE